MTDERMREAQLIERIAQITAHRGCGGEEHDPSKGKLHGCCVVCLTPWPCAYAGTPPALSPPARRTSTEYRTAVASFREAAITMRSRVRLLHGHETNSAWAYICREFDGALATLAGLEKEEA